MTNRHLAALALAVALAACRAKPASAPDSSFPPPNGKRGFSLSIDKSQTEFLKAGDAVQAMILLEAPRADGTTETRSETLAARAEVLRVEPDWGDSTGLVQLALTPEEAQYAALAADREDRLFLNKVPDAPPFASAASAPPPPALEPGHLGLAVLVYPDQQEFLRPGDRVDVIATRQGGKASGKSELTAITLFQDVLVLGVRAAQGDEDWSTVQLMLTPEQAKTMTRSVAAEDNLVLAVRSPTDRATRAVEPAKMSRKFDVGPERASSKS
jgi:hypothetical protein